MTEETQTTTEQPTIVFAKKDLKKGEYLETIGRRKTATARVRVMKADKTDVTVNGKKFADYFQTPELRKTVLDPATKIKFPQELEITVKVSGGGIAGQAVAVRHGLSRALTELDAEVRSPLKKLGFLKRDPRSKERKKFGLKKARKAAQWSKR